MVNLNRLFLEIYILKECKENPDGIYIYDIGKQLEILADVAMPELYNLCKKMLDCGWMDSRMNSCSGRMRRYYKITAKGKEALTEKQKKYAQLYRIVEPQVYMTKGREKGK